MKRKEPGGADVVWRLEEEEGEDPPLLYRKGTMASGAAGKSAKNPTLRKGRWRRNTAFRMCGSDTIHQEQGRDIVILSLRVSTSITGRTAE